MSGEAGGRILAEDGPSSQPQQKLGKHGRQTNLPTNGNAGRSGAGHVARGHETAKNQEQVDWHVCPC
jgi:hypothetical protein